MIRSVRLSVLASAISLIPVVAHAQSPFSPDTQTWCKDATTMCWNETRRALAGIRFVFEPQLGVLVQQGDNKFESTNFKALEKIGIATPLYGRQLGAQFLFIYPSTVAFDAQSPVRVNKQLLDEEGKVDVEWGFTLGATVLDGVLSTGFGVLHYDRRDFKAPESLNKSVFGDTFFYFNIQAIEALKSAIKSR